MVSCPKIVILLLNYNGKEDTLTCLASLRRVQYPHWEILVVDNGSQDGSIAAIQANYSDCVHLIEAGDNLGFAEGNNVGIRWALNRGADAVFLLNNDTRVDPYVLEAFETQVRQNPEVGIWGAKVYRLDQPDRLDHMGGMWNAERAAFDFVGLGEVDSEGRLDSPKAIDYVCGAGMFVRREVFEKIGLLEKDFFLIWEEADFCFRARRAGFAVMTCPDAKIWHKGSASFQGKPHSTYFWWRNRLLWIRRNCSREERITLYRRQLLPEMLHLCKLYLLKSIQFYPALFFCSSQKRARKKAFLRKTRAALQGMSDYFLGRLGKGSF